jgi:hypothetical protein
MATIDVNLPRKHKPTFPNRCVICCAQEPSAQLKLCTGTIGWWTWLLLPFEKPFTVVAPACPGCKWRLHLARFASLVVTICLAWLALSIVWPKVADFVPRAARKWAMAGLALLGVLPQLIYELYFPKPFDITAYTESVDYEFGDHELAVDFAMINLDAAWVKVNDKVIHSEHGDNG